MAKEHITTVDIGTNSVKVLQLDLTQSGITVVNSGERSYPRRSATERIPDEVVIDTLSQLFKDRVIRTKPVAMAVPRHLVTVKKLTGLPTSASDEEIDKMVPIQVNSELPFAIQDSIYSTYNLRRSPEGISLEVVATKKSSIQRYVYIAEQIGLKLIAIIPSAFATYGLIFDQFKEQLTGRTVAVADIGAGMTDICVIQHGRLDFSRSLTFGGNSLTQSYEMQHKLSFAEAEERKISEANLRSSEEDSPEHEWANNLASQIDQSFRAFRGESGSNGVNSLWLCGGGSLTPGLDDYLADKLDLAVNVWDPLQRIEGSPPEEGLNNGLSVALGLGVISAAGEQRTPTVNANLLPEEISQRAQRTRRKITMFIAAAAAIIVIVGAGLAFMTWRHSKAADYEDVRSRLETLEKNEETREARAALENSVLMQQAMTPYVTPLEVLRELSNSLPDRKQIALNSLSIDKKGKVTMSVEANSHADVSKVILTLSELQLLDKVKLFDEVKHGSISKVTKDKRPILQVQIACLLNQDAMQEIK
ncbi:pilus assembly protein PilM [Candidatus Poribacteria bacterium]